MRRSLIFAATLVTLGLAACEGNEAETETTVIDTTTVPGSETVDVPTEVPTTDTVVRSQTIETEVDTIEGDPNAPQDTLRR